MIALLGTPLHQIPNDPSSQIGQPTSSVAIGDVNGDGKADVVLAAPDYSGGYPTGTGTVRVSLGNGDGSFGSGGSYAISGGSYAISTVPSSVALGDINGDGKTDIVTANSEANSVSLFMGDGDGTFGATQSYTAGTTYTASAVAIGDFNGDHKPDLAVTDDSTYGGYFNTGGTSSFAVRLNAGDWSSARLAVSGFPTSTTAGTSSSFTVTIKNANGTTDVGYAGTVHFVSTDPQAGLPADYTFTAADQGTHTFNSALKTVGTQNLWATDTQAGAIAGGETGIVVHPGAASTFRVPLDTNQFPFGTPISFTVSAYDAYGNVATGYNGTVRFTSTDPMAVLPADSSLANGVGHFTATLNTAGNQLIDITDLADPSLTGEWNVPVAPIAQISGPFVGLLNQPMTFTLLASGAPAGANYTFYVNWLGSQQILTGPSGTTVTLTYTSTDRSLGETPTLGVTTVYNGPFTYVSRDIDMLNASMTIQADPADSSKQMLVLDASQLVWNINSSLNIDLTAGANNGVTVTIAGNSIGNITTNDGIPFALVEVFGAQYQQDNTIDASSLSISTVLVGGNGTDILYGGSGRNLLIGGEGTDTLHAGSAGDILIGGGTSYSDADTSALASIMGEWDRTDVDYATRVDHLDGNLSGGLNGSSLLSSATISDDGAIDVLDGGLGLDWFIGHFAGAILDQVNGQSNRELATSI